MSRVSRVLAAARQRVLRLVPVARRDWVEAVWAEAPAVPRGPGRLAWRIGGVRLLVQEALMGRGTGSAVLFAVAAALVAWAAWPGSAAGFATSVDRVDLVAIVVLLAGLALAAHRVFGPAAENRTAWLLRGAAYAALLALVPAKNVVEQVLDVPPRGGVDLRLYRLISGPGFGNHWQSEITFLVVIALYAGTILWLTSRRARVDPATLGIGAAAGVMLGAAWYVAGPLGFGGAPATNPWLPGADAEPFLVLAVLLFFAAPILAAILAHRRITATAGAEPARPARLRQVTAAALVTSLTGALVVTVAGTGTIAAVLAAPWLRTAVYRSHPLSGVEGLRLLVQANPAALGYSHQITAAMDAPAFLILCILFPAFALVVSSMARVELGTAGPPPRRGGPPGSDPAPPSAGGPPGLAVAEPAAGQMPAGTAG